MMNKVLRRCYRFWNEIYDWFPDQIQIAVVLTWTIRIQNLSQLRIFNWRTIIWCRRFDCGWIKSGRSHQQHELDQGYPVWREAGQQLATVAICRPRWSSELCCGLFDTENLLQKRKVCFEKLYGCIWDGRRQLLESWLFWESRCSSIAETKIVKWPIPMCHLSSSLRSLSLLKRTWESWVSDRSNV